jgi:hypothetical protein
VAAGAAFGIGRLIEVPEARLAVLMLAFVAGGAILASLAVGALDADPRRTSGLDELRRELDRARRHRRSFALLRLRLTDPALAESALTATDDDAIMPLIRSALRITDRAWVDDSGIVILMPESDRVTGEGLADRIRASAPDRFDARVGIAAFPDDGLTSGALLDALDRDLEGNPVPSPIVPTLLSALPDMATEPGSAVVRLNVESEIG